MPTEQPCPADHPLMIAWKAYQETDEFAETLKFTIVAIRPLPGNYLQCARGSLWAAFMAGFNAASDDGYRVSLLMCTPDEPDEYTEAQRDAWDAACEEIKRRITANREKARAGR